jgi:hypothetical protein
MTDALEKISGALLPAKFRRYLTFRWMTLFVLLLLTWNAIFKSFVRVTPDVIARFQSSPLTRPAVFIPYNLAVLIGFLWIYATRRNQKYYLARVILYGMLLGAVCGQLVGWLVPFRT